MFNWDYNLPKNWRPKTDEEWIWYLSRVINYGPRKGEKIDRKILKKYLPLLKIDKQRREFIEFLIYGKK